jgi:HK97 gp10 family phage protein
VKLDFAVKSNRFPTASAAMKKALGVAFASSGRTLLADMQRRTPVDKGELRSSEQVTTTDTSLTLTAGTDHALYVHQGTRRMGARPFMKDTVDAGMPVVTDAIIKAAASGLG